MFESQTVNETLGSSSNIKAKQGGRQVMKGRAYAVFVVAIGKSALTRSNAVADVSDIAKLKIHQGYKRYRGL